MTKLVVAVLASGWVLLAACGSGSHMDSMHSSGSDNAPVVSGASEIAVRGTSFKFSPKTIEVSASENVTIALTSADIEHDIPVKGIGHIVHAAGGETEKGGLKIDEPGTYDFYCSIPGHRGAGMKGTIIAN